MTGSRRRPGPALLVLPILAVGLALGAGMLLLPPGPEPSRPPSPGVPAAFAPPTAPLVVNLHRAGGGPASVGLPVALSGAAIGLRGIASLELWAGSERVEATANRDPNRPAATARWEWTPTAAGETILVARAFDAAGHAAQSAPVRVTVQQDPPRSYRLETVPRVVGESLEALVARVGGDLPLARYLNPDLGDGPLPAGDPVEVPIFDAVSPITAVRDARPGDLAPVAAVEPILALGLAEPQVVAVVDDCTITATATGGGEAAKAYAFSALPPVGEAFVPLPPIGADGGTATTTFVALGGMNYLTVEAYTADSTAPSPIVPVDVPPGCGTAGWQGDARLDGGTLVAPATADRAYLYLRVGEAAWQRVPSAPGTFVEPVGGVLDFGSYLPAIAGHDLALEAWGWSDGKLVKLGAGTYTAPSQQLYGGSLAFGGGDPILGLGTTLDIVVIPGGGEFPEQLTKHSAVDLPGPNSTSGKRSFKWSTSVPGITHLVWQVLPYPLGESSVSLAPPFLIDSDTVQVQGNTSGYFSLDLKPYLLGDASGVWSSTLLGEELINQVVQAKPYFPGATKAPGEVFVDPGNLWWPQPTGGTSVSAGGPTAPSVATLEDLAYLAPPASTLYVRVIPFVGTIPVPNASNSVSFDVVEPSDPIYLDTSPPAPPPTYPGAYDFTATFFAPTGSNPKYARCVKVVEGGKVLQVTMQNGIYAIAGGYDWSNGTVHCQPPPDDDDGWSLSDAFETFAGWVGDVWDYVSDGYAWMQDQVVNAVLLVVPCEKLANQVVSDGKEVCRKIAKTALQAALASFGIPPEIPDWDTTISGLKGDLRTFILENAKDIPGVSEGCDVAAGLNQASSDVPTCEQIVDKAIDAAIKQIKAERSKAAAANAGVIVPPGVTVEPDPRSMAQPPHFEVTITRTGLAVPADVVCTMSASMSSAVASWSWKEYAWNDGQASVVSKSGAVSGEPFMGVKQVIAPLAPGQTATYDLWLTKRTIWFEPDGWNDHYAEQYYEWNGESNHAWVLLQAGATVTAKLSSNCLSGGQAVQVLTGSAWN